MMDFKPFSNPELKALRDKLQKLAEGKLVCTTCGNKNWEQFLFVGTDPDWRCGCKRCAAGYRLHTAASGQQTWVQFHPGMPDWNKQECMYCGQPLHEHDDEMRCPPR